MDNKPVNLFIAAIYGTIVALVVGYGLCFLLIGMGIANVTSPGTSLKYGADAFARAGLNLCAIQHALLVGAGGVGGAKVSAQVLLPLTVWAFIPAFALFVSGYASGRLRSGASRFGVIFAALLGTVFYAAILAGLSRWFSAPIDSGALPSAGGFEFAPPSFDLHPRPLSTFIAAGLFGVIFAYIGSHFAACRVGRGSVFSRWWVCGKSIVPFAIIIQLMIAVAAQMWLISKTGPRNPEGPAGRGIVELQPSVAGIAYGLINGATLRASVESDMGLGGAEKRPVSASLNLYKGMKIRYRGEDKVKTFPGFVYAGAALIALLALGSGALAVRWGSRDGSLPTAIRIVIVYAAYLWFTMFVCAVAWKSIVTTGHFSAASSVSIGLHYDTTMLATCFGVFVMAFIGAYLTNRRYVSSRTGFPPV
ncbi:MAG: hypothetical protein ABFD49_10320 [Armatimonadota bacterium]|nr:hypothetical protein [bacterium]